MKIVFHLFRRSNRILLLSFFLGIAGTGCKSTYSDRQVSNQPVPLLRSNSRIYVGIPFDATFKKEVAHNSGKQVAEAIFNAFARNTRPVYISRSPENLGEALDSARRVNADYVVYPTITRWEDRATEWSGRRDKLQMRVDLIELETSQVVYAKEIEATGKLMTDGGDTPADLLQQPLDHYANDLFRRTEKPSALW